MPRFELHYVALATLASLLAACGRPPTPKMPPPEVGVVVIQPQTAALDTELPGRTSAIETADVRPQVNGIILARPFTEGSLVQRGQLLYRIDPAPYRAALSQAEAQLANAQAAQTSAKLKADRYDELIKTDSISRQDDDDARAAAAQATAAVQLGQAAVQAARINLDYTELKAPISGRIGRSSVTPGALVTASQATALTTIQRLDSVYVDISQSSADILALRRNLDSGQAKKGGAAVRIKLEDGSDYPTPGVLQFSDVTVDQSTGSVVLRAIVPNPKGILLPGMFVRAVVTQAVQPNAILAPQVGVTRDPRGMPIAYVADNQNVAQLRNLKTGQAVGDKWLVLDGLKAGDRMIVEGLQKVMPGAPVRPVPAGSPPGGGGAPKMAGRG